MSTKYEFRNGILTFFDDDQNYERVLTPIPHLYEEFLGTTLTAGTTIWLAKDTHAEATEANVADKHLGVMGLGIGGTGAEQEAGLTMNDQLNFNLDKGPVIQFVAALHTLPTLLTEIYFGVANNYVKGRLAAADEGPTVHAMFHFSVFGGAAGGLCKIYTDDAVTDNAAVTTGITVVADAYHAFLIDFTDIASVKFYIDGTRVASATTFDMSNSSNVMTQPYMMVYKDSGAGVGDLYIDSVRVWSKR